MSCETNVPVFAVKLTCFMYRRRLLINGHTEDYLGNVKVSLTVMLNPVELGRSDNFFVRTYDGLN